METTIKGTCNELAELLSLYGVRQVVVSPGSRNTPLIIALSLALKFDMHAVIDERSAAFIGMGMAMQCGEPVALICTSGSAVLNYAPAVAEAFYRQVPLIVISADRPADRIDQDDNQTIHQHGALSGIVKTTVSVTDNWITESEHSFINRKINDALHTATDIRKGPVHINVHIAEPLNTVCDIKPRPVRKITTVNECGTPLSLSLTDEITNKISSSRILIVCGFMRPSKSLNDLLIKLSYKTPVFAEGVSNIHGGLIINDIDEYLATGLTPVPDIVITFGGALISRYLKEKIKKLGCEHWLVGSREVFADTFGTLTASLDCSETEFAEFLLSRIKPATFETMEIKNDAFFNSAAWSDIAACEYMCRNVPQNYSVHLSNGMTVRYCQNRLNVKDIECNRGVSGIDGCASTALGYSTLNDSPTLLITGDMCMQYDLAALSSNLVTPKFKIIVICNSDGGIFRIIKSTRDVKGLNQYISPKVNLPLDMLAPAYGFKYFEATEMEELKSVFCKFIAEASQPAILAVKTDSDVSAKVWLDYLKFCKERNKN